MWFNHIPRADIYCLEQAWSIQQIIIFICLVAQFIQIIHGRVQLVRIFQVPLVAIKRAKFNFVGRYIKLMKSLCPNCYKSVETASYSRPDICPHCKLSFTSAFMKSTDDAPEPSTKKLKVRGKLQRHQEVEEYEGGSDTEISPDDFKWEVASSNLPEGQKMVKYTLDDWARGSDPIVRAPGNISLEEAKAQLARTAAREFITVGGEG